MAESRKLAAIMAVDVVGYSRLMGEDEAGTARSVRDHREAARPLVATRGGRIVKTMGDGLLLEFPSIVDAVECAVSIQKLMDERNAEAPNGKPIIYRIGVHLGDVLIDGDDILGEGVNIAARLEGICEPRGVLISGSAHEHVRGRIDANFVDLGEKALKNIAWPVRVYAVQPGTPIAAPPALASTKGSGGAPRLSIVVLPFANMGGDPEQEYFVDGVTESLTTDLSRMNGMVVIGRNTAFTYKGKAVDLKQIGRELNVRYVLEGSIQRGGARVRVNAQLIEAESGSHLWAERFDKPVADLFDMQDEIVSRLAAQLDTELIGAEARRAEHAINPDAMDLYFQGMAVYNMGWSPELLAKASNLFDRALAIEPRNVSASLSKARIEVVTATSLLVNDRAALLASAEHRITEILSIDPNNAIAHLTRGTINMNTNRAVIAIACFERALSLDHNLALAHGNLGLAKAFIGQPEDAEAHVKEAVRLSPRDKYLFSWFFAAGTAKLGLGLYEEGVIWLQKSVGANPNFPIAHFLLAAALALAGQADAARASTENGLKLDAGFTLRRFEANRQSDNPRFAVAFEQILNGMREAGIPAG